MPQLDLARPPALERLARRTRRGGLIPFARLAGGSLATKLATAEAETIGGGREAPPLCQAVRGGGGRTLPRLPQLDSPVPYRKIHPAARVVQPQAVLAALLLSAHAKHPRHPRAPPLCSAPLAAARAASGAGWRWPCRAGRADRRRRLAA
jgi:hypothetical protein